MLFVNDVYLFPVAACGVLYNDPFFDSGSHRALGSYRMVVSRRTPASSRYRLSCCLIAASPWLCSRGVLTPGANLATKFCARGLQVVATEERIIFLTTNQPERCAMVPEGLNTFASASLTLSGPFLLHHWLFLCCLLPVISLSNGDLPRFACEASV